ncbi:MAG TPA: hypothetical protein VEJ18_06035, partial [Planctomycetota bacterium]|nr:hypothetical protein [Planctomycetota bacterium]
MKLLVPLLLAGTPVEWVEMPWYILARRAKLIVAGEVVHVERPLKGPPVARFKVETVLKGRPEGAEIRVPFKTDHTWACDFTIAYTAGKRYLLLIDDENPFRVVHYPDGTCNEISALDAPAVRFVQMALDVDAGRNLDRRLPELIETLRIPRLAREALHLFRTVPREAARPLLSAVREAHGTKYRENLRDDLHGLYRRHRLSIDAEITRDLSLVAELLKEEPRNEADLLDTLT